MINIYLSGSDHVKPEIIDKVPVKERKRQEAIFELIHSEKSYVFSLNLVKEVWVWLKGVVSFTCIIYMYY